MPGHEALTVNDHAVIDGMLEFFRAAEALKTTLRSGFTSAGERESVAEHSWRLCLMALVAGGMTEGLDVGRLLRICIVHDLGEAVGGDIPAPEQVARGGSKSEQERRDLEQLVAPLSAGMQTQILSLWDEYEAGQSPEAKFAKGLDKIETVLQHTQGQNPRDFDYRFNLAYGQRFTRVHPLLLALRAPIDVETERRADESVGYHSLNDPRR